MSGSCLLNLSFRQHTPCPNSRRGVRGKQPASKRCFSSECSFESNTSSSDPAHVFRLGTARRQNDQPPSRFTTASATSSPPHVQERQSRM